MYYSGEGPNVSSLNLRCGFKTEGPNGENNRNKSNQENHHILKVIFSTVVNCKAVRDVYRLLIYIQCDTRL